MFRMSFPAEFLHRWKGHEAGDKKDDEEEMKMKMKRR